MSNAMGWPTTRNGNVVLLETMCPICEEEHAVEVPADAWDAYCAGARIQDALHMLSEDECEMIMTGICPTCWNWLFAENDKEVEPDE